MGDRGGDALNRAADVAVAGGALVLASPLLGLAALAVKLEDRGPVLYRQTRVGRDGEDFELLKLRTMVVGAERIGAGLAVNEGDSRITRVGRVLRKLSLDELPQFWNVVRGDMSLVGPRPELVEIVARYEPWQHQRHAVKPGLTGLWQVSSRGTGMMHLHTDIDLEYIETMGFGTDLKILFRTIPATLARRGN